MDNFYPRDLVTRLGELSKVAPDQPGVHYENSILTYRDLEETSNGIASALQKIASQNDTVGVLLPAGRDLLPAILAIFKLKAVYLPLNPNHPPN